MKNVTAIIVAISLSALAWTATSVADSDARCSRGEEATAQRKRPPLPPNATIERSLRTPNGVLKYSATAGSVVLKDAAECRTADVAFTAYILDSAASIDRPVTFAFNGGPGAASAYLHLGLMGPQRVEFGNAGNAPSDSALAADNPATWLDFTDLVFVDPPGTGYSRIAYEDVGRDFYGVEQDVAQLSRFVTAWLAQTGRATSPKYLVGESYAGIRVAKMAHRLQKTEGVGVSGLILLSPVLDDIMIAGAEVSPLPWVSILPSLAAAHFEQQGKELNAQTMSEVEHYARGDYLRDLLLGARDTAAIDRLATSVATLTGLDRELVRRLGGRIDAFTFTREMRRKQGEFVSAYDTAVTSHDPFPFSPEKRGDDPILMGNIAPLASAMSDLTTRVIGWQVDRSYRVLNLDVKKAWDYGKTPADPLQSATELRRALSLDGRMRVLVAHGYTDIRTPYFASRLILDQIPAMGEAERLRLRVYPGGHMFYSRAESAGAFREDVLAVYREPSR